MRSLFFMLVFIFFSFDTSRKPLEVNFHDSASYRWLNKNVLESRVLDNMESLDHWMAFTNGAQQIVDARVVTKVSDANRQITGMTITNEKPHGTGLTLRMQVPTKLDVPGPKSGRGWGTAGVRRQFDGEDWSASNRISIWVYPDCPGFYIDWLELRLFNDGVEKLPALFGQEGESSFILKNHEWNQLVWEIGNVARDKVTSLEFSCYLSGNEPEATDTLTYYFDQLELQKVDPDYIEGWEVWPGRISYSHTGYLPGAEKTAIANGLNSKEFRLIDQRTGETVLSKPILTVNTHLGNYQVMDFSEFRQTGSYILEAGDIHTNPFRIDPNVWRNSILKALNFFYTERCGMAIPGIHGVCHRDWTCNHGDRKMVINGGWHDAGDLTQGLGNTGDAVYAMFSLAEKLNTRDEDPELHERLLEEAQWGLDWILKTNFRDGDRFGGSANSRRTNGIIGDFDDIAATSRNSPMDHFVASAAEAIAYRVLNKQDTRLASYSLEMAIEDWHFAVEGMSAINTNDNKNIFRGTFDSDNVVHEIASSGIQASIELWKATGNQKYVDKAVEWAKIILNSQQRTKPDWNVPLTGFFYTGPGKDHLLHYCHRGREHAPILALTQLCEVLPNHPDWMKWYSAVTLHSQYLKTIAKYTEPYGVMPASIYADQEYQLAPESRKESYQQQVLNGIPLGKGHYLRLFPVWMDYRGHFGTILPQANALINAAQLRGDLESAQLAQHQLEWVIGRNPFSQSAMWGEGYDFPPLYSVLSGDLVGGLPVGIQTHGEKDVPYWPVQATWTYKEIWVHPVIQWIWLMRDLNGPIPVEGQAASEVEFIEAVTGQKTFVMPEFNTAVFHTLLPQGRYNIHCNDVELTQTLIPGMTYNLDLRPGSICDFDVSSVTTAKGEVTINLSARGAGKHSFSIRMDNLILPGEKKELILKPGQTGALQWRCKENELNIPWVAVVVPDEDLSMRKEITGATW